MRRSYRDAIVGFSILGGIIAFSGTMLWLRGVRLSSSAWRIAVNFQDASGLAERSPVTYRGILIGSVQNIAIKPNHVQATIEIDKKDLLLPIPVFAKITKSSLLGGDVEVALTSKGKPVAPNTALPGSLDCKKELILCSGDIINGKSLSSIASLTSELEKILKKAENEDIMSNLADSTKQFNHTQKELEILILQAKEELEKAGPIIELITEASIHINNILSAIDNPETLEDIKETASSTRSITRKIDSISSDVKKIMEDKVLMDAVRRVTIGLGELFTELYPYQTSNKANN